MIYVGIDIGYEGIWLLFYSYSLAHPLLFSHLTLVKACYCVMRSLYKERWAEELRRLLPATSKKLRPPIQQLKELNLANITQMSLETDP